MAQGSEELAKDDTIFYGRDDGAGMADIAVDLSQVGNDFNTIGASHISEAVGTRFVVQHPWSIEFDVTANNADSGYLFTNTFSQRWSVRVGESAGLIRARYDIGGASVVIASLTLPGVGAGDERFVIGWSAEPNLATTGASDAVKHRLYAINVTDGSSAEIIAYSAARDGTGSSTNVFAAGTTGTSPFTGTAHAFRFSQGRVRTPTETYEDFVARTSSPSLVLASRCEYPIVDPACDLGDAGQLAGPVYFMGAQAVKQNALRLLSPIVNEHFLLRPEITANGLADVPTQYRRDAPDDSFVLLGNYVYYRPVPPIATHLRVRVFVKQWSLGSRMRLRMYALNRPPVSQKVVDQGASLQAPYCGATASSTDHGSGGTDGEWVDLGLVQPAINSEGCTWLCLAVTTAGNPGTTEFEIGAIVVEPGVME
ncbi:MAG TPA: hypothetical protein VFG69_01610 [Nannocystaceae bacterium]|nr:hypothetical protein [Nannocystaceae bacterium]